MIPSTANSGGELPAQLSGKTKRPPPPKRGWPNLSEGI